MVRLGVLVAPEGRSASYPGTYAVGVGGSTRRVSSRAQTPARGPAIVEVDTEDTAETRRRPR